MRSFYYWVKQINLACPAIRKPDLCIFLDLTPEESLRRISANRSQTEIYENTEALTSVCSSFHCVLEDLVGTDIIVCIDASETPQRVPAHFRDAISKL